MLDSYKKQVQLNLKKASSLIEKIQSMLEKDTYCVDIAQQLNATLGLLRSANEKVLESHLITCGNKMNSVDPKEKELFIKEIVQLSSIAARK